MKKLELVYREILLGVERKNKKLTQASLSKSLGMSLSTVNNAIKPLKKMGAIRIKTRSLEVVDEKKIMFYWASVRDLEKDIVYKTRVSRPVEEIEKAMPSDVVFGAYSAFKFMFNKIPADYSEVYVYAKDLVEIKKRFPENKNPPNLFVLKGDVDKITLSHLFVDLWNLKEWYAKEFLKATEEEMNF